jgi:type II secretory pathway component HofQ
LGWTFANGQPANVWSPQPAQINQGLNIPPQTALAGGSGQSLNYTLLTGVAIRGKGTVKIGT